MQWLRSVLVRVRHVGDARALGVVLPSLLARPHLSVGTHLGFNTDTCLGSLVSQDVLFEALHQFGVNSWTHDDQNVFLNRALSFTLSGYHWWYVIELVMHVKKMGIL